MRFSGTMADPDAPLRWACAQFLGQLRLAIPVGSLTVVLLGPESDTSRVIFSWGLRQEAGTRQYSAPDPAAPPGLAGPSDTSLVLSQPLDAPGPARFSNPPFNDYSPTMSVPLRGREKTLGAVLLRSSTPSGYSPEEGSLAQRLADQLALHLENIRLQQQMEQRAIETQGMDRISGVASSGAPVERIYYRFATEIKKLVDYHRLSIYLADPEADLLTCAYRTGQGVRRRQPGITCKLSGSGCEAVALERRSRIVHGLMENPGPTGPEGAGLAGPPGKRLRSALMVPVVYAQQVIGVVQLEHRTPRAYGPDEEGFLQRAAASLGPPIANSRLYGELSRKAQELASARAEAQNRAWEVMVTAQAVRVLASSQPLQQVFRYFAAVLNRLVPFHCAALSWIDPNGCDIQTVQANPGDGSEALGTASPLASDSLTPPVCSGEAASGAAGPSIHTRLHYRGKNIGVLTLWRCGGASFTPQEQDMLDRMGVQIAPAVQNARLYQQARRQAYQLEQLLRGQPSFTSVGAETSSQERFTVSQRLDSLRRELLVDAAHSLRTPLTSIKGYSSTLLQRDVDWPPDLQREFLETIGRETDRLNQVVSDLLAPTQSEMGALQLQPVVSSVEDLFHKARSRLAEAPVNRPVHFAADPALPEVLADQSRLAQVIAHLVHCADRTADPGATLLVEARWQENQPLVSIGPAPCPGAGSQPSPSSAADHASDPPLLGNWPEDDLRLIVSRTLLEAHGITLEVGQPESGQGAFWFALPVAASADQEDKTNLEF